MRRARDQPARGVLVTGGAGFVGSHACEALAAAGYLPVVYDNLVTGHREAVKWGPLVEGDIADADRLDGVLARYRPQAIMHFAGSAYVGESIVSPLKYYRNNAFGTLTLLDRAIAIGVQAVIFSSSCATYGVPEAIPISEQAPQQPISPYGRSKLTAEMILRDLTKANNFSAVALRYFNAAGASSSGEIGEEHEPETHLIPLVLMAARDPSRRVKIFGTDFDTPDGTCVRDYVHVEDLALAHVKALHRLLVGNIKGFDAFNLGSGRGYSVREVISKVQCLTGRHVCVEEAPRRPGDPAALVADASRASSLLNWKPIRSELPTIIRSAWHWIGSRR